ncbi:MAG: polysaccharide pyruvyl transferase family protein [Candidatus Aminicenantes bacterium]|nr:polysaccharide pyruvyl transferase family protein [Candidatus Aminicenantes bacterium]
MTSQRVSRILIVNVHSQANAGDYAILIGQLQLLKKMFPAAMVTITSRTPELDRPLLAARGVKVIAPIFNAPTGFSGKWRVLEKVVFSLLFPRQAWIFLRRLRQSDFVMACGGGYFYSTRRLPGLTFWQNYLHIRLAIFFKKKIIFFPQSYGPLENTLSRRLLAGLLASGFVRVVFAREETSLAVLREILPAGIDDQKLQSCPDMAFNFSPELEYFLPTIDLSDLPRPRLALALRDWSFPALKTGAAKKLALENYLQAVIATCQALHRKYGSSFFIYSQAQGPSLAEDDRLISGYIHDRLRAVIPCTHLRLVGTPLGVSPAWIIDLLRQADMLITSRMHAAIFAFLAGIPAAVIGYQHKSSGILQSLDLQACALAIEEVQSETLQSLSEDVLQNRKGWVEKIERTVPGIRKTIEAKFLGVFKGLK